jgi:hypothetical protein
MAKRQYSMKMGCNDNVVIMGNFTKKDIKVLSSKGFVLKCPQLAERSYKIDQSDMYQAVCAGFELGAHMNLVATEELLDVYRGNA